MKQSTQRGAQSVPKDEDPRALFATYNSGKNDFFAHKALPATLIDTCYTFPTRNDGNKAEARAHLLVKLSRAKSASEVMTDNFMHAKDPSPIRVLDKFAVE